MSRHLFAQIPFVLAASLAGCSPAGTNSDGAEAVNRDAGFRVEVDAEISPAFHFRLHATRPESVLPAPEAIEATFRGTAVDVSCDTMRACWGSIARGTEAGDGELVLTTSGQAIAGATVRLVDGLFLGVAEVPTPLAWPRYFDVKVTVHTGAAARVASFEWGMDGNVAHRVPDPGETWSHAPETGVDIGGLLGAGFTDSGTPPTSGEHYAFGRAVDTGGRVTEFRRYFILDVKATEIVWEGTIRSPSFEEEPMWIDSDRVVVLGRIGTYPDRARVAVVNWTTGAIEAERSVDGDSGVTSRMFLADGHAWVAGRKGPCTWSLSAGDDPVCLPRDDWEARFGPTRGWRLGHAVGRRGVVIQDGPSLGRLIVTDPSFEDATPVVLPGGDHGIIDVRAFDEGAVVAATWHDAEGKRTLYHSLFGADGVVQETLAFPDSAFGGGDTFLTDGLGGALAFRSTASGRRFEYRARFSDPEPSFTFELDGEESPRAERYTYSGGRMVFPVLAPGPMSNYCLVVRPDGTRTKLDPAPVADLDQSHGCVLLAGDRAIVHSSSEMVYFEGEEPQWAVAVGAQWMEIHGDQMLRLPGPYRVGLGFEATMEPMVYPTWRRP
ncbi:MAG: hypothetical protein IV100_32030 [Myxococcales bacterium]|nr:hypothetical protein [Myxococcales bacterium]